MDLKTTPATWRSAQFKSVALSCPVAEPRSLARFCNPMHGFHREVGSLSSVVFLSGDTSLYQIPSSQGLTMVSSPPPPSAGLLKYQVDHGVGHKYSKPVISICKTELIDNKHRWLFSSTGYTWFPSQRWWHLPKTELTIASPFCQAQGFPCNKYQVSSQGRQGTTLLPGDRMVFQNETQVSHRALRRYVLSGQNGVKLG